MAKKNKNKSKTEKTLISRMSEYVRKHQKIIAVIGSVVVGTAVLLYAVSAPDYKTNKTDVKEKKAIEIKYREDINPDLRKQLIAKGLTNKEISELEIPWQSNKTIEDIVDNLLAEHPQAKTDLEKARIFYDWISGNFEYNADDFHPLKQKFGDPSAVETVESREKIGNCTSLSYVLMAMCRHLRIDAKYVDFFKKLHASVIVDNVIIDPTKSNGFGISANEYNILTDLETIAQHYSDEGKTYCNQFEHARNKHEKRQKFRHALKSLRLAVKIDPYNDKAHVNLATLYTLIKKFDLSEKEFKKAIALKDTWYSRLQFAHLFEEKGDFSGAEKQLKKAIELNPNNIGAYLNIGALYCDRLKRHEDAVRYEKIALSLCSDEKFRGAINNNLGKSYLLLGQFDKAEDVLKQSIESGLKHDSPYVSLAYVSLGMVYAGTNRYKEAREAWNKALKINPNSKARDNLRLLEEKLREKNRK